MKLSVPSDNREMT